MKKLFYLMMAALLLAAIPEIVSAQSNDPFEQQVIQTNPNKKSNNQRRRRTNKEEVAPAPTPTPAPTPAPQPKQEEKVVEQPQKPENNMTISNPCSDWLDFELVSMIGSIGTQEVAFTIKFTSHEMNDYMYVGGRLIAYDCDGNEHSGFGSQGFNVITDVPVKTTIKIRDRIDPRKTKALPVVCFNIGDCRIEMRNVPIDWK